MMQNVDFIGEIIKRDVKMSVNKIFGFSGRHFEYFPSILNSLLNFWVH